MGIAEYICYRLSRELVLRRQNTAEQVAFDMEAYQNWRGAELQQQFNDYFSFADVVGKDVVDFGCGQGELSFLVAQQGAISVTGLEACSERYAAASAKTAPPDCPVEPRFFFAEDPCQVNRTDQSADLILCFDVLEHILEYQAILQEWQRILRPGGHVFIWWVPWWNPYGPHIESLVPIPWCHVLFSEKTLLKTCARIYDMPEFKPRFWSLDSDGSKKSNKWLTLKTLPDINKLTMYEFEQLCAKNGLTIRKRQIQGFGSSTIARMTHVLLRVPRLREFFTSSVVYTLEKPG